MGSSGSEQPFVALGARSMAVLKHAYAAAVRGGTGSVSTLHVLAQIAAQARLAPGWLSDTSRRGLLVMATDPRRTPSKQPVGELVSPPVDEFAYETQASLREVEWGTRRLAGRGRWLKESDLEAAQGRPQWTNGARSMVAGALAAARDNGMPYASPAHLLFGMVRLPGCAAAEYLYVRDEGRAAAAERLSKEPSLHRSDRPHPELDLLTSTLSPGLARSLLGRLLGLLAARAARLARLSPLSQQVQLEARRQAVRLGHRVVEPAHVLLAMLTVDAQLGAEGFQIPARHVGYNRGGAFLNAHHVHATHLRQLAMHRDEPQVPPAEVITTQLENMRPGDPLYGAEVVAATQRALELSLAYQHPYSGTSHLLLALVEDHNGGGATLLREFGVDPAGLREQVQQTLNAAPTW